MGGLDAASINRDGHRSQTGGLGHGERPQVGRRLDQDGGAGRQDGPKGRGERRLAASGDDHVIGFDRPAHRAGEPLAEPDKTGSRRPIPDVAAPGHPANRSGQGPGGHQVGAGIARRQRDHALRRGLQQAGQAGGVHRPVRERHRLPGQVRLVGGRQTGAARHVGTGPGPGHDQPLRDQQGQSSGNGDRADPVLVHQGASGRQRIAGAQAGGPPFNPLDQGGDTAIVRHESKR